MLAKEDKTTWKEQWAKMSERRAGYERQEMNRRDCVIIVVYTIQKSVKTVLKKGELPPEPKQDEVILTEIEEEKEGDEENPRTFVESEDEDFIPVNVYDEPDSKGIKELNHSARSSFFAMNSSQRSNMKSIDSQTALGVNVHVNTSPGQQREEVAEKKIAARVTSKMMTFKTDSEFEMSSESSY